MAYIASLRLSKTLFYTFKGNLLITIKDPLKS